MSALPWPCCVSTDHYRRLCRVLRCIGFCFPKLYLGGRGGKSSGSSSSPSGGQSVLLALPGGTGVTRSSAPFSTCSLVPRTNRCAEKTGWPRWGRAAWHGQTAALAAFQRERRGGMRQWGPRADPAIFRPSLHLGRLPEEHESPRPLTPCHRQTLPLMLVRSLGI